MGFFNDLLTRFDVLLLVFARCLGLFTTAPVFGSRNIPTPARIGLGFFISLLVMPGLSATPAAENLWVFAFLVLRETLVGLSFGFLAALIFSAIQTAGEFIDLEMGFGIVNVIDPQSGVPSPLIGNFTYMLALLIYLTTDGHHTLFSALLESYALVPLGGAAYAQSLTLLTIRTFTETFLIALKIALPTVAALFFADLALAFLARTVPQMNVFVVGLPVKIGVGFILLLVALPLYLITLDVLFGGVRANLWYLLRLLGGRP